MHYRRLGRTNLDVSLMGLGSGGASQLGQRSGVAEPDAHRAIHRALDLGINLIDTAADYGESEAILGRALADVPRDRYIISTKFTPVLGRDTGELKPEAALIESVERSLTRLGTDHLDVLHLHGVTAEAYAGVRDRFVPVMRRLREAGKIRHLGLTESFAFQDDWVPLRRALADDHFDVLMVGYNLLTPGPEVPILAEAARRDVGILVMCAVRRRIGNPARLAALIADLKASGDLAPDALPDDGPLDWLIHDDVDAVTTAAYRFAAGHPGVSAVLTGTANAAHLEQNVRGLLGGPLPPADRQRLLALFGPLNRKLGD